MNDEPGREVARIITNTAALIEQTPADAIGSIWRLEGTGRDLDSNIIALPAGGEIQRHDGPSLDVLILVLQGNGILETAEDAIALSPGDLAWLPRRSPRRFVAGTDGLRYLTVHQRKPGLSISPRR